MCRLPPFSPFLLFSEQDWLKETLYAQIECQTMTERREIPAVLNNIDLNIELFFRNGSRANARNLFCVDNEFHVHHLMTVYHAHSQNSSGSNSETIKVWWHCWTKLCISWLLCVRQLTNWKNKGYLLRLDYFFPLIIFKRS